MVVKLKSKLGFNGLRRFSKMFVLPVLVALFMGVSMASAATPTTVGQGANLDSTQPSIKVAVVAYMPTVAYGGLVLYGYTVTNTGTVPLSNVTLADDKCQPVTRVTGDTNLDGILNDSSESWIYSCSTSLTTDTTNTATATGTYNGITATATSTAHVTVGLPTATTPVTPLVTPPRALPSKVVQLPVRLKIPKLKINAAVQYVGLTSGGAMDVPKGASFRADVAWYKLGARPGETGTAVISGHSGRIPGPATIFNNLQKLQKGDLLYVQDSKGKSIAFVVQQSRIYSPNADAPEVFSSTSGTHLNLITCIWNKSAKAFTTRIVVFADIKQ